LKSQLFDRRLVVNVDGYLTDFTNIDEGYDLINSSGTIENAFLNAGAARIEGFEGDFTARPTDHWTIYGTTSYTGAVFTKYNAIYPWAQTETTLTGSTVSLVPPSVKFEPCNIPGQPGLTCFNAAGEPFVLPPWQYSIGTRYELPVSDWGRLALQIDWTWHSRTPETMLGADPVLPASLRDPFYASQGNLNGRLQLDLPGQKAYVAVYVTNMLDNIARTIPFDLAPLGIATTQVLPPRMFGIEFHKAFGSGE
jgi:iron complex outermembrane recepter protein